MNNFLDFKAKIYLDEYYRVQGVENKTILDFFHTQFQRFPKQKTLLDIGSGPVIFQLISAAVKVQEFILGDISIDNIRSLQRFCRGDNQEEYWNTFVEYTLTLEGVAISESTIDARLQLIRSKIKKVQQANFLDRTSLQSLVESNVEVVMKNSAIETSVQTKEEFSLAMANIVSILKPDGFMIGYFSNQCNKWTNGEMTYNCFPVDQNYIRDTFPHYGLELLYLGEVVGTDYNQDYKGIFCFSARKI